LSLLNPGHVIALKRLDGFRVLILHSQEEPPTRGLDAVEQHHPKLRANVEALNSALNESLGALG
jgi:hypothetical protein